MKRNVYINCKLNIYTGLRLLSNKYFNFLDTSRVNRYELEKDTIIIEEDDLCVVKLDQDKIKIINTFKKSDTRYIPVN